MKPPSHFDGKPINTAMGAAVVKPGTEKGRKAANRRFGLVFNGMAPKRFRKPYFRDVERRARLGDPEAKARWYAKVLEVAGTSPRFIRRRNNIGSKFGIGKKAAERLLLDADRWRVSHNPTPRLVAKKEE